MSREGVREGVWAAVVVRRGEGRSVGGKVGRWCGQGGVWAAVVVGGGFKVWADWPVEGEMGESGGAAAAGGGGQKGWSVQGCETGQLVAQALE